MFILMFLSVTTIKRFQYFEINYDHLFRLSIISIRFKFQDVFDGFGIFLSEYS